MLTTQLVPSIFLRCVRIFIVLGRDVGIVLSWAKEVNWEEEVVVKYLKNRKVQGR